MSAVCTFYLRLNVRKINQTKLLCSIWIPVVKRWSSVSLKPAEPRVSKRQSPICRFYYLVDILESLIERLCEDEKPNKQNGFGKRCNFNSQSVACGFHFTNQGFLSLYPETPHLFFDAAVVCWIVVDLPCPIAGGQSMNNLYLYSASQISLYNRGETSWTPTASNVWQWAWLGEKTL